MQKPCAGSTAAALALRRPLSTVPGDQEPGCRTKSSLEILDIPVVLCPSAKSALRWVQGRLRPLLVPLGAQVQGDNIAARSPPQHALQRGKDFPGTREPGVPSWMGANDQICSLSQGLACP